MNISISYAKVKRFQASKITHCFIADDEEIACTSSKDTRGHVTSDNANAASSDGRPTSQSRRKQDLSTIRENNDEVMVC